MDLQVGADEEARREACRGATDHNHRSSTALAREQACGRECAEACALALPPGARRGPLPSELQDHGVFDQSLIGPEPLCDGHCCGARQVCKDRWRLGTLVRLQVRAGQSVQGVGAHRALGSLHQVAGCLGELRRHGEAEDRDRGVLVHSRRATRRRATSACLRLLRELQLQAEGADLHPLLA